jgi:hypothetical protein
MGIHSLLVEINDLLSAYVAIHDDVFSASWRRIVPIPGIFKAIDWKAHQSELHAIADSIEVKCSEVSALISNEPNSSSVHNAGTACVRYCNALHDAVTKLHGICTRMLAKANGTTPYTAKQYNADFAEYQAAVDDYYSLGDAMNMASSVLRRYFA